MRRSLKAGVNRVQDLALRFIEDELFDIHCVTQKFFDTRA